MSRNIPQEITTVNVTSRSPGNCQNHTIRFCLKMLKWNELMLNKNSKTSFENHFAFINIFAWLVFLETHFLKNNIKITQYKKIMYYV